MWRRTWLLTAILVVGLIGGLELGWRSAGHRPSVVDDPALWSQQRARIYAGEKTVALIGNSRIQLGFASDVFEVEFPHHRLARLEVPLHHPVSALRDLAEDPEFRGVVIASVAIPWLRPGVYPDVDEQIDYYRNHYGWNVAANRWIASLVQSHVVAVNPNVHLRDVVVRRLESGEWPEPNYIVTRTDRSRAGDYQIVADLKELKRLVSGVTWVRERQDHLSPEDLLAHLAPLDAMVERIRMRGGEVVFVRMPTSGRIRRIDENQYPKREYWDRFANRTPAPTLHYQDVPALAGFECPDGLHLDERDAPGFTAALLDELVRRGILDPAG